MKLRELTSKIPALKLKIISITETRNTQRGTSMGLCYTPPNPQKPFDGDLFHFPTQSPATTETLEPQQVQPGKKSGSLLFPSELFPPSLFCLIY